MYTKKLLSAAAAVAIMSTGAMAFDMNATGAGTGYVAPITNYLDTYQIEATYKESNLTGKLPHALQPLLLSVHDQNSTSARTGDALIYPAFQQKKGTNDIDGWKTEITVRNTQDVAVIAKAVLYAQDDSRELKDFNIYLSSHDAFRFTIADGKITTDDGSYVAGVDPSYSTDAHVMLPHRDLAAGTEPKDLLTSNPSDFLETDFDEDGNFIIGKITEDAGYVIIYGMTQALPKTITTSTNYAHVSGTNRTDGSYHLNHSKLFQDYRILMDICRDNDNDSNETHRYANWRTAFNQAGGGSSQNGASTLAGGIVAPSVDANCTFLASSQSNTAGDLNRSINYYPIVNSLDSNFTSVSSHALFGEVRIYHTGDNRDLMLPATALANYTVPRQMMLWATGEYASIQDRRIVASPGTLIDSKGTADYNVTGILLDSGEFNTTRAFYTFNKDVDNVSHNTLLVTQPTKRPIVMSGHLSQYWIPATDWAWGKFQLQMAFYDDNEKPYAARVGLRNITSPVSSDPALAYKNELHVINDPEETETSGDLGEYFQNQTNGYADILLGQNPNGNVLPAIVTQMSSSIVGGENQLNWIYSVTE